MATADALKQQGNEAFKTGRFAEAVQHFTAAIALDSSSHLLHSNRSGALAALGRYSDALADAERCLQLNPAWAKGYSRKGAALYGLGRYEEALVTYETGLAADSSSTQIAQAAADVRQKLAGARQLLEAAGKGDVDAVRSHLRAGIHPDGCCLPDGSSPLLVAVGAGHAEVVAELLAKGAHTAHANNAGETATILAQRSMDPGVIAALATAEAAAAGAAGGGAPGGVCGTAGNAAAGMSEGRQSKPSASSSIWGAAKGLAERSRAMAEKTRAAAEQTVQTVQQKAAEMQKLKEERERASEASRREAEEKARAEAAEKARVEAEEAEERARLETAAREEGERVAAEAAAAAAAAEAVADAADAEERAQREQLAEVSKQQGNEAFKAGRYPEAVKLYSQALEIAPSSAVLLSNRSGALAASGSYEAALADAERCIALEPQWAKGHTRKASSLHGLKRFMAAVQAYEEALAYEPEAEALLIGRRQSSFALAMEAE